MQNTLKTRTGKQLILPSDQDDLEIGKGLLEDPDTFELNAEQFRELRPAKAGRPPSDNPKERITIRLSPDVVKAFRATGSGWQTRMDAALKEWLYQHPDRMD